MKRTVKNSAPPSASTIIPDLVIPAGTDPRVAEIAKAFYAEHLAVFATAVDAARQLFRDHAGLITSKEPDPLLAKAYSEYYDGAKMNARENSCGSEIFDRTYSRDTLKRAGETVAKEDAEKQAATEAQTAPKQRALSPAAWCRRMAQNLKKHQSAIKTHQDFYREERSKLKMKAKAAGVSLEGLI